jgi:hypothetical protein
MLGITKILDPIMILWVYAWVKLPKICIPHSGRVFWDFSMKIVMSKGNSNQESQVGDTRPQCSVIKPTYNSNTIT